MEKGSSHSLADRVIDTAEAFDLQMQIKSTLRQKDTKKRHRLKLKISQINQKKFCGSQTTINNFI